MLLELVSKGGWLTVPIMACSVVGLAIFLERVIRLHRLEVEGGSLLDAVSQAVSRGDLAGARDLASKSGTPMGRLLHSGLSVYHAERTLLESVLDHAIEQETRLLSRYLPTLATVGGIAPLLGLLGTVVGMIKAFMAIEAMGGQVDASVLAGGIWEAMLTTAFGLSVALPTIVAHSYLVSRVDSIEARLEDGSIALLKSFKASRNNTLEGPDHAAA
jgi:biopolymer transport protein ExbB